MNRFRDRRKCLDFRLQFPRIAAQLRVSKDATNVLPEAFNRKRLLSNQPHFHRHRLHGVGYLISRTHWNEDHWQAMP